MRIRALLTLAVVAPRRANSQGDAGISIDTCGQLLSVTEQLSIAIDFLQEKVRNRACVDGMAEDDDTGICGYSGCTNQLYDEYDEAATTDVGCENSAKGCCRVLTCVTDKSCLPDGAVQELTPVELDGKPGECVDDAFGYLVGTTNRTCAQLPTQMNMLGQWAQGQSLHALDGEHKTFGCDSPVATFLRLLDQSGERSCFDRDEVLQLDSCPGEKCTADCAAVVAEGKCSEEFGEVVDVDILPSFGNYCPVTCGLCNPPPFETGVTQTVKADDPADAIHNGAYIFDYAYTWLSPLGSEDTAARKGAGWAITLDSSKAVSSVATRFDAISAEKPGASVTAGTEVMMRDVCPITCNRCQGA